MKNIIYSITALIVILFVSVQLKDRIMPGFSGQGPASPSVTVNGMTIAVEIADNFEKWRQGLSGREALNADEGMLFVFPDKQIRNFWMKDMNFPLDIIWIDNDKIVNISENLSPEGEVPENSYSSILPANYVLEVNGGFAGKNNVKTGDNIIIDLDN